jgi:uroporphyrinogen III methyltransferase/synthase
VLSIPTIEIGDPKSFEPLDRALQQLAMGDYDWVVFLSVTAVQQVVKRLHTMSREPPVIAKARVAAVGGATEEALTRLNLSVDLRPEAANSLAVAEAMGRGSGRILLPRAAEAPPQAVQRLRSNGWEVAEVVAYRTLAPPVDERLQPVRRGDFDAVIFTSGSTVRGFSAMVSPSQVGLGRGDSGERRVVCIGPVTAGVAGELGFRVDGIATEQSEEGLVEALVRLRSERTAS